ncbi:hypothetical protein GCM10027429_19990 [Marivirga atlantica]|jgi:hypothetical protein|uniref:GIY-YIG catalytic domain-containing protein n=1 Tax=Marivirga atlantica TaxID=1548457 RepID=A0A937DEW3_9BACT|nr:hypothetical protein [Marivirga atlantica]MBL0765617.1 hypothetical protein [Marivirga atlantica]
MKLHEAIVQILKQRGTSMSTTEIAYALNKNRWYSKKDGSDITAFQIHGRTRNYDHLFKRDGAQVSLKSHTGMVKMTTKKEKPQTSVKEIASNAKLALKVLMNEKNFKAASEIDSLVPDQPGLYCLRIKDIKNLNGIFLQTLKERKHNIIYIGIASKSLQKRMLGQELRARGHGTFFRSLGAVLGFRPQTGSLKDKVNKNNYVFSKDDNDQIIEWINQNLLVNWVAMDEGIQTAEKHLIRKHSPLLNIADNTMPLTELVLLRETCRKIAS